MGSHVYHGTMRRDGRTDMQTSRGITCVPSDYGTGWAVGLHSDPPMCTTVVAMGVDIPCVPWDYMGRDGPRDITDM